MLRVGFDRIFICSSGEVISVAFLSNGVTECASGEDEGSNVIGGKS